MTIIGPGCITETPVTLEATRPVDFGILMWELATFESCTHSRCHSMSDLHDRDDNEIASS